MIWAKSCPKCGKGDLMLERDLYGWYRQCVQCGYLQDMAGESQEKKAKPARSPVPTEPARATA